MSTLRCPLVAGLACVAVAIAAPAAVAQTPSLTGEAFTASSDQRAVPVIGFSGNCDVAGTSTYVYTVSGSAFGPYPGSFTETGSVTIGPQIPTTGGGFAFEQIQAFSAQFTIDSPTGQVSGSKALGGSPETATAACQEFTGDPFLGDGSFHGAGVPLASYTAEITTPAGATAHDEGTTAVSLYALDASPLFFTQRFDENFSSDVFVPPAPVTKAECKDGGWQAYTELGFKNQGDCVSYVVTQGRNEPG